MSDKTGTKRKEMEGRILFYKVRGEEHGCFSNFSPHAIVIDGKRYHTSEHYFQAKKFEGTEYEEKVRTMHKSPMKVATYARRRDLPLRKDWEEVKDDVMETAVRTKFSQYQHLKGILIKTGDCEIVEDSPTDYYWGIGEDGSGKNMLGKILMKVREELKASKIKESKKNVSVIQNLQNMAKTNPDGIPTDRERIELAKAIADCFEKKKT
jgi:ribA/ribD-fused uncharacterized protein